MINRPRRRQCTNIQNIACLRKIVSIIRNSTQATVQALSMKKSNNTEAKQKKCAAYKKACIAAVLNLALNKNKLCKILDY